MTRLTIPVAVTGWGVHLPGGATAVGFPAIPSAPPAGEAHQLLGRKGLLYKEPATRLALCAVHRALGATDGRRGEAVLRTDTAVVASSNLGNVETVVQVAGIVATEGGRGVSPMAAPNASSNVIASSVALWFRFGGPNLMVCSGATSGLDAVMLGVQLIRSGRAGRVVVVGAEPDDEVAAAVYATGGGGPLRAGAACVLLEPASVAGGAAVQLEVGSGDHWPAVPDRVVPGAADAFWGDCYGAQGVIGLAIAAGMATADQVSVGVRCGDETDGWRTASVGPSLAARRVAA